MRQLTVVLAIVAVVGLAMTALAKESTTNTSLLYGKVVSVDAAKGTILITKADDPQVQVTVTTDANTKITVSDKSATLADIKPDMIIRVSPATGTAADIRAFVQKVPPTTKPTTTPPLYGKVVSVDAAKGTILITKISDPQVQVTVTTDANTKITVSDKSATLADIKPDMTIRVSPATGTAAEIRAFTQQPPKK